MIMIKFREQITIRQCRYSVPARLIGARVRVALSASELVVFDGSARVATHPRMLTRGECVLELDHYLEILLGKPGALPGSTALAQARAVSLPSHRMVVGWVPDGYRMEGAGGG